MDQCYFKISKREFKDGIQIENLWINTRTFDNYQEKNNYSPIDQPYLFILSCSNCVKQSSPTFTVGSPEWGKGEKEGMILCVCGGG